MWAQSMGQHYVLKRQSWDAPIQGGESDDESEKVLLPMEVSIIHWGFDCSRMSLQDKQYVKSILLRWGRGSQVLSTGSAHTSQRCLVFYHAHLLSSESVLFLQAFLEENYQDTVLWLTSEHPLPQRIADWCIEIPVPLVGEDRALHKLNARVMTVEDEIAAIYAEWQRSAPTLSDVKKIRAIVYGLLHRNIRWTDGFHQWMFALDKIELTAEKRLRVAKICTQQPFTGSGQTVPSYRIPILWENYLCNIRNAIAPSCVPLALALHLHLAEPKAQEERTTNKDARGVKGNRRTAGNANAKANAKAVL